MEQEGENNIENEGSLEVEEATPEDAWGITEVLYRAWLDTYPNEEYGVTVDDIEDYFKDSFLKEKLDKRAENIRNTEEGEYKFVAKDGDKVVGFVRTSRGSRTNQLKAIYILPEYQGRGLGYKLWNQMKQYFDEDKYTIVHVAVYNDKAISFYKKLGFEETGKEWTDERFRLKSGSIIPETELVMKGNRG